ncbi:MAG: hypothetical protein M1828_003599 [Chrysothrix sp. TS-e1954]|nr:MAG: hypothetical protein M1828_003599 [Chrysothrix sp. TS-e1954]
MNGTPRTPRMPSAYPLTPRSDVHKSRQHPRFAQAQPTESNVGVPLVPFETIDAPSQRFYAVSLYTILCFWRLYDFYNLTVDETESLWLFMKWISIDGVFLFGLPGFRIPWLEWSTTTMTILFLFHAAFDAILMFRIPIPLGAGVVALTKVLYDKELAVSERYVKPADIINNPSLILGRQIINILPEGSVLLNPEEKPICLDSSKASSVTIPLQINQTVPTSIEMLRYDLDTGANETVMISGGTLRKLLRDAERNHVRHSSAAMTLNLPLKKTGLYGLGTVIDETKLEVQHRIAEVLVVACPTARIQMPGKDRCRGDQSELSLQVEGTPPLKVKYRKTVNGEERDVTYQSIQPEDFVSPLQRYRGPGALLSQGSSDISWARSSRVNVPLSETLSASGQWSYSIDEIVDALGNPTTFLTMDEESGLQRGKDPHLEGSFMVHDRPTAALRDFDFHKPIQAAKGEPARVMVSFNSVGRHGFTGDQWEVESLFTPVDDINPDGGHALNARTKKFSGRADTHTWTFSDAGLYSLRSVSTQYCKGEIVEPASVMLVNPPEPELGITTEDIVDQCAHRPIGLHLDLNMTGTPPFQVQYTVRDYQEKSSTRYYNNFDGPRGQLEFKPSAAGQYIYVFNSLSDAIYRDQVLRGKQYTVAQSVKPSVSASFVGQAPQTQVCIDQAVSFDVKLQGEGPWTLEYEVVHGSRRDKFKIPEIATDSYRIETESFTDGGDYSIALVGVTDSQGCREALQQDARIYVRQQRPKAAFGTLEGKRSIQSLEGKNVELPLRMTGEGPWYIQYTDTSSRPQARTVQSANDFITVSEPGVYQLTGIRDSLCPGSVEEAASSFEIVSLGRPQVSVPESPLVEHQGGKIVRKDVCEGEEDSIEITFSGRAPFDLKYQETIKPSQGSRSIRNREMNVPLNTAQIRMDTAREGQYDYSVTELGDYNYDHDASRHQPLLITQRVNGRPSATFSTPGKVYSMCHDSGDSLSAPIGNIPITLSGRPPFTVDLEIRHQGKASKPQHLTIPNITSTKHSLQIPPQYFHPGTATLTIRRIRDSLGCERFLDLPNAPRVQLAVHDRPSIAPADPPSSSPAHVCVGDRLSYTLAGSAPFTVFYVFNGAARKATSESSTFRRIAETPGNFTITAVQDASSSGCQSSTSLTRIIHGMPSVKIGKGTESRVDIHAGGEVDIIFDFPTGEPPFEFVYTRSENRASSGRKGAVLATKVERSEGKRKTVKAGEEGTYEVVAIRDRWCSFAMDGMGGLLGPRPKALGPGTEARLLEE